MKRSFRTTGFAALLALSAPAEAGAVSGGADDQAPDELRLRDASKRWFFGDGGLGAGCDGAAIDAVMSRRAEASPR